MLPFISFVFFFLFYLYSHRFTYGKLTSCCFLCVNAGIHVHPCYFSCFLSFPPLTVNFYSCCFASYCRLFNEVAEMNVFVQGLFTTYPQCKEVINPCGNRVFAKRKGKKNVCNSPVWQQCRKSGYYSKCFLKCDAICIPLNSVVGVELASLKSRSTAWVWLTPAEVTAHALTTADNKRSMACSRQSDL